MELAGTYICKLIFIIVFIWNYQFSSVAYICYVRTKIPLGWASLFKPKDYRMDAVKILVVHINHVSYNMLTSLGLSPQSAYNLKALLL